MQVLSLAKGFRGRGKNCIRVARERVEKALQYAYRDRKAKKRDMRSLWIQRVNAGTKEHGVRSRPSWHGWVHACPACKVYMESYASLSALTCLRSRSRRRRHSIA